MEETKLREITAENLHDQMKTDRRPVLINALNPDAFTAKRIAGSINIPIEKAEIIETVVPDKKQDIVVYCANSDCTASPKLAEKLMDMGYGNVKDFDAGLAGWRKAGFQLVGEET